MKLYDDFDIMYYCQKGLQFTLTVKNCKQKLRGWFQNLSVHKNSSILIHFDRNKTKNYWKINSQ